MHADYRIRAAKNDDLGVLADIERAAAAVFRGVGIEGAFLDEATSLDNFSAACAEGRLWVAVCDDIRAILADERQRDLPMERRLVMRLALAQDASLP